MDLGHLVMVWWSQLRWFFLLIGMIAQLEVASFAGSTAGVSLRAREPGLRPGCGLWLSVDLGLDRVPFASGAGEVQSGGWVVPVQTASSQRKCMSRAVLYPWCTRGSIRSIGMGW